MKYGCVPNGEQAVIIQQVKDDLSAVERPANWVLINWSINSVEANWRNSEKLLFKLSPRWELDTSPCLLEVDGRSVTIAELSELAIGELLFGKSE